MASTFDEAELMERVDNDRAFLAETVEMLAGDGRTLMAGVRQAVAAGDAAALGRTAHALKGMLSNFCSPAAQEAALELERMGKSGELSAAPAAVARLDGRVEALIAELTEFVRAGN